MIYPPTDAAKGVQPLLPQGRECLAQNLCAGVIASLRGKLRLAAIGASCLGYWPVAVTASDSSSSSEENIVILRPLQLQQDSSSGSDKTVIPSSPPPPGSATPLTLEDYSSDSPPRPPVKPPPLSDLQNKSSLHTDWWQPSLRGIKEDDEDEDDNDPNILVQLQSLGQAATPQLQTSNSNVSIDMRFWKREKRPSHKVYPRILTVLHSRQLTRQEVEHFLKYVPHIVEAEIEWRTQYCKDLQKADPFLKKRPSQMPSLQLDQYSQQINFALKDYVSAHRQARKSNQLRFVKRRLEKLKQEREDDVAELKKWKRHLPLYVQACQALLTYTSKQGSLPPTLPKAWLTGDPRKGLLAKLAAAHRQEQASQSTQGPAKHNEAADTRSYTLQHIYELIKRVPIGQYRAVCDWLMKKGREVSHEERSRMGFLEKRNVGYTDPLVVTLELILREKSISPKQLRQKFFPPPAELGNADIHYLLRLNRLTHTLAPDLHAMQVGKKEPSLTVKVAKAVHSHHPPSPPKRNPDFLYPSANKANKARLAAKRGSLPHSSHSLTPPGNPTPATPQPGNERSIIPFLIGVGLFLAVKGLAHIQGKAGVGGWWPTLGALLPHKKRKRKPMPAKRKPEQKEPQSEAAGPQPSHKQR